jgi:hypothetical protein
MYQSATHQSAMHFGATHLGATCRKVRSFWKLLWKKCHKGQFSVKSKVDFQKLKFWKIFNF